MSTGDTIRDARTASGMTQDELAARSGVSQSNIAAYETGKRVASEAMVARLVRAARARPSIVLQQHRDEVVSIVESNRASNVRVFGSVARGEDTPESDIDLLVSFAPDASTYDLVEIVDQLEQLLGRHVDVVSDGGLKPRHNRILQGAVAL